MTKQQRAPMKQPLTRAQKSAAEDWIGELEAADTWDRVGNTPAARLSWLSDFAEADLPADSRRWEREARAFMTLSFRGIVGRRSTTPFKLPPAVAYAVPTVERLPTMQAELRRGIHDLVTVGHWQFKAPDNYGVNWLRRPPERPGSVVRRDIGGDAVSMFLHAVAELLLEIGGALRLCDAHNCGRLFAAARPHQRRCSAACTNRVNAALHRARHPEKRHERHAAKQRERLGSATVQVGRRRK